MSKATKGTSTLFPQVSRGESNDAAKGLLDDAGDSSGDEANYAPRGDYAPPRPVTTQPSEPVRRMAMAVLDNQSVWRLQSSLRVLFRVCGVWVTYRHGYFLRSMFLPVISGVQSQDNKN